MGIFAIGLLTALFTAFYTFRLIFVVFFGKARGHHADHVHESPAVMAVPLILLAVLALSTGLLGSPFTGYAYQSFILGGGFEHHTNYMVMGLSIGVAVLGIFGAWLKYSTNLLPSNVLSKNNIVYKLLVNNYYIDEIYEFTLVRPTHAIARYVLTFDQKVIDGAVNGVAKATARIGGGLKYVQTGYAQNYALVMVVSVVVLIIWSFRAMELF